MPSGRLDVANVASKEMQLYYPVNEGFLGTPAKETLRPGQLIDRFGGGEFSRFFAPPGTPAAMRALPPESLAQPLRTFEVLRPLEVQAGVVAPAFNQIGLGVQYRTSQQLGELLEQGVLREVLK